MRTSPETGVRRLLGAALLVVAATAAACLAADSPALPPSADSAGRMKPIMQAAPTDASIRAALAATVEPPAEPAPSASAEPLAPSAAPALAAETAEPAPPIERRIWTHRTTIEVPLAEDILPTRDFRGNAPRAVVMYVSGNRGRTWVRAEKCVLPARVMEFRAANDGEFWCLFRGEPITERGPAPAATEEPQRIVIVDTAEPVFRQLVVGQPAEDGSVRVTWLAEDGLPAAKVKAVAVHETDGTVALPTDGTSHNQGWARFQLTVPGTWQIGVQIEDLAGNASTGRCRVTILPPPTLTEKLDAAPALGSATTPATPTADLAPPVQTLQPGTKIEPPAEVRSRQEVAVLDARLIQVGYRWDAEHPPTRVGLWVTRDGGRTWALDQVATEITGKFVFRAAEDGAYGFRTHRELGDRVWGSPQAGLAPEREVILDTTPPAVEWTSPLGGPTGDGPARRPAKVAGTAALRWTVVEANPAESPVTLEYRLFTEESWHPLAGPMADTGAFDWLLADTASPSAEVRLSYRDRAGHVTTTSLFLEIVPGQEDRLVAQPKEVDDEARNLARRAYAMATVARLQENWEAAEKQLLRSTSADPSYARAWVDLGGIYVHDGKWDSASDAYRKALALAPESENASFGLAQSLANQRDLQGAAETLDKLVQKSPENADAWRLYGDVLYAAGNRDKARQCWMTALGLGGGHEANLAALRQRLQMKQ